MTPLLAALSSFLVARARAVLAAFLSPAVIASRVTRIAVFSSLLTALLRSCAFLLVPMRLICDLMLAIEVLSFDASSGCCRCGRGTHSANRVVGNHTQNQGSTLPETYA